MNTYVVLLRGINVGGRNTLPMKELVALCESLGCTNVKTYIQSGNVVLQCASKTASRLADMLSGAIDKQYGFAPQIMLLRLADIEQAIAANPFPKATSDPARLHVGFLDAMPKKPDLKKLEDLKKKSERFLLKGKVFYLHTPDGMADSKLAANAERALGVAMTARNWRTLLKIRDLAKKPEE